MISLDFDEMRSWFGFGVAGNFAGHLEQAGEADDFAGVDSGVAAGVTAPKGIFPWYAPGSDTFLGEFPLSGDQVLLPAPSPEFSGPLNLQIEPEVALACHGVWNGDTVVAVEPFALGAFNDCSIRRPGAPKISYKKNWGSGSKGVAREFFAINDLTPEGPTSTLRLVCYLEKDGAQHEYGLDSPLLGYSYYGQQLLDWIVDRLANQKGSPETPLEDVGALMAAAGHPENVLIGIGATRYTELGESTYLQAGDVAIVRVYDTAGSAVSELRQTVTPRQG